MTSQDASKSSKQAVRKASAVSQTSKAASSQKDRLAGKLNFILTI
jgi:hypothetical protein